MKSNKVLAAGLIGAALAFSAPAAFAQARSAAADTGWYVGGSFGQAIADIDSVSGSLDDKDTAWKIFGGYQINRTFSVELGYTDLGAVNFSSGASRLNLETTAWEVVGVASFPFANQFAAYGKVGFFRATTEFSGTASGDDDNNGLTLGAGVRYNFNRNLGVQGEWQRYAKAISGPSTGAIRLSDEASIDVFSVGVVYKF
jgi:OmpA-OmpF porin, OOP family